MLLRYSEERMEILSVMNLNKAKLPKIYKRNGRDCYLDPIRKRLIYITPEETVRQRVISYLMNDLAVPAGMLQVEEHLSHYGIDSRGRADIVILGLNKDNNCVPITVIECKAENVMLDEKALMQALGYSEAIGSVYTFLTNGIEHICFKYDNSLKKDIIIEELPDYSDMLTGECKAVQEEEPPERIPYEALEKVLLESFDMLEEGAETDISRYTPMSLALPAFNLWEGLLDERVKMPSGNYGLFKLIEDYGVRMLTYGNASGGKFYGPYRSFLVDVSGSTEIFSIGFGTYWKSSWIVKDGNMRPDRHPKTCLSIAHDDEKSSHHSLQLLVDDDAVATGKIVRFYHNGRIAIGKIGSGKKSELHDLVAKRYPKILTDDKYYLGKVTADHLLRLDEPDVIDLIVNLISYSIVRDEYREDVKARKA